MRSSTTNLPFVNIERNVGMFFSNNKKLKHWAKNQTNYSFEMRRIIDRLVSLLWVQWSCLDKSKKQFLSNVFPRLFTLKPSRVAIWSKQSSVAQVKAIRVAKVNTKGVAMVKPSRVAIGKTKQGSYGKNYQGTEGSHVYFNLLLSM